MSSRARTALIWALLLGVLGGLVVLLDPGAGGEPETYAQGAFEEDRGGAGTWIVTLVPIVLLLAAIVYFVRRTRTGASSVLEIRRSRARRVKPGAETLTFADIGGAAEAKERLGDIVDYLRAPESWVAAGVRLPRGVLLEGPPGCGKTLLARAVAGEAKVPVFVVSASEFVEMFVGVGAARIRDLFETALKAAPAVIFIDELDAVGRRRGSGIGAGHDEREQTLNQLLVSLDGFERNHRVVVLAATNRSDVLDRALLRPGRFDVRIAVPPLGEEERAATLAIHTRGKPLGPDVSLATLAQRTAGWSGAELEHLTNEAALAAVRRVRAVRLGGVASKAGAAPPEEPLCIASDFERVLADRAKAERKFDRLDQLLLESASQLAQPGGPTEVRVHLADEEPFDGTLLWADATFLKIELSDGRTRLVPKRGVRSLEARAGTAAVAAGERVIDRWANRAPDVA